MDCTASPHLDSGHIDLEQEAEPLALLQPRLRRCSSRAASCNSASPANIHVFTPNFDYDDKLTQKFSCTNNCLNTNKSQASDFYSEFSMSILVGTVHARCSAAPAADPGPRGRLVAPAQDHPPEADKEMSTVVHGTVSIGGLGMQLGKAHLLRGEVDTCEIRHAGIRPLVVGSKTSLNITFNTNLR